MQKTLEWDSTENHLSTEMQHSAIYSCKQVSPFLVHILSEARREISLEKLSSSQENKQKSSRALAEILQFTTKKLGTELTAYERDEILKYLEQEQKPYGILQRLVDDPTISDIIVSAYNKIAIQQGRKNFRTDLSFTDQASYEEFIDKLLHKAGTTYSTKKPIADGMIGNFARIHVVNSCICESGPYLTIRLNRYSTVDSEQLIQAGMGPLEIFKYLKAVIACGATLLIAGEVGTGKTTLVRALAADIPHEESILVIEDTPEVKLNHPQVRYITTREANCDDSGRVTPAECIRGGMRMAMNRIIFGEMRDAEAAEAFIDVCASGHPGLSTIHAKSPAEAIARLELFLGRAQRGVQRSVLTEQISNAVQVIIYVAVCKLTNRRRIFQVKEIGPFADGILRQREIFSYLPEFRNARWKLISKVSAFREALETLPIPVELNKFPTMMESNGGPSSNYSITEDLDSDKYV